MFTGDTSERQSFTRTGILLHFIKTNERKEKCKAYHIWLYSYVAAVQVKKNPHFLFFSMINCLFVWEKSRWIISPGNPIFSPGY